MKGILVGSAWTVRDLDPSLALRGIVVDVEIRALVKAVVERSRGGRSEVIVDVRIATGVRFE